MIITNHSFGNITLDGVKYQADIVIHRNEIIKGRWWRKEGHMLQIDDIKDYLEKEIKIVLIGRGYTSRIQIANELQIYLLERDIILQALSTPEACERFNELNQDELLSCFHLTC